MLKWIYLHVIFHMKSDTKCFFCGFNFNESASRRLKLCVSSFSQIQLCAARNTMSVQLQFRWKRWIVHHGVLNNNFKKLIGSNKTRNKLHQRTSILVAVLSCGFYENEPTVKTRNSLTDCVELNLRIQAKCGQKCTWRVIRTCEQIVLLFINGLSYYIIWDNTLEFKTLIVWWVLLQICILY